MGAGTAAGQPRPPSARRRTADVSPLLDAACAELRTGELIHGENFSMYEAMVAIEIMAPKMDSGMLFRARPNSASQAPPVPAFRTADEAIAAGAAPTHLSAPQLVDIMDRLLCVQAAWWGGQSLAQTLFSCVYLMKMAHTEANHVLHAFCRAVLALTNVIRSVAIHGGSREEEDFVTTCLGLPLAEYAGRGSVQPLARMHALLSAQEQGEDVEARQMTLAGIDLTETSQERHMLLARVAFLLALYDVAEQMERATTLEDMREARAAITKASAALDALRLAASGASTSTGSHSTTTEVLASTREDPALPVPEDARDPTTASGRAAEGFCESISYAFLPPAPMREVNLPSFSEAMGLYGAALHHLDVACQGHTVARDVVSALDFLGYFASLSPGPVARSYVLLLACADKKLFGQDPSGFVLGSVHMLHLLPSLPPSGSGQERARGGTGTGNSEKDKEKEKELKLFAWRASLAMENVIKSLCANPSRQRRQLAKCLAEWNAVLEAAQQADGSPSVRQFGLKHGAEGWWRETILVSWAVENVCGIISRYLLLGFSLDLYAPWEMCSVYWYLEQVMATLLHNVVARESSFLPLGPDASPAGSQAAAQGRAVGSRQGRRGGGGDEEGEVSVRLKVLQVEHLLCKGMVRMLVALARDGKMRTKEFEFTSPMECFQQRFEALTAVQVPEPQTFQSFESAVDSSGLDVRELLHLAHEYFQTAAARIPPIKEQCQLSLHGGREGKMHGKGERGEHGGEEAMDPGSLGAEMELNAGLQGAFAELQTQQLIQMERVAQRNCTALQVAHRAGMGPTLKATFDFSIHPHFAVMSLRRA